MLIAAEEEKVATVEKVEGSLDSDESVEETELSTSQKMVKNTKMKQNHMHAMHKMIMFHRIQHGDLQHI